METKEIKWDDYHQGSTLGRVNGLFLFTVSWTNTVKETPYTVSSQIPGLRKRYAKDLDHAKVVAKEMLQSFVRFITIPPTPTPQ